MLFALQSEKPRCLVKELAPVGPRFFLEFFQVQHPLERCQISHPLANAEWGAFCKERPAWYNIMCFRSIYKASISDLFYKGVYA
jgi:hypothetical protein